MNKKLDFHQRLWVEDNGSIYIAEEDEVLIEWTKKTIKVRKAIAFNVGKEVAQHIVSLHNNKILDALIGPWNR